MINLKFCGVLVCRTNSPLSRAIRNVLNSKWSHVGIIIRCKYDGKRFHNKESDKTYVVEINRTGVHVTEVYKFIELPRQSFEPGHKIS